jgi:hypothetical protein
MLIDLRHGSRFVPPMRLLLALIVLAGSAHAALPPELADALKNFRADAPRGWSFTQKTEAEGKSTVEHSNAARVEFDRWSLVQKDGRAPTVAELRDYADARSQRSRGGTAPKLVEQFDPESMEVVTDGPERAAYRFRLRPGESRDQTAAFLRATVTLHKPTHTIESILLQNTAPFSPTLGVKIAELKTLLAYSLPAGDVPSLPQKVETEVRGRAFWFKSLDAHMVVTFSDYVRVGRKPGP